MTKLPQVTGAEVIRRLKRLGFEQYAGGKHPIMRNPNTSAMTTVPCHGSKTVKTGTLKAILKQAGVSVDEFNNA
jgi:predicted RNA binding protein YcfA (HicA-like mRNA interferase family)